MVRLENWSFTVASDPFTAPECQQKLLTGEVFGHPQFSDGYKITTSAVHDVDWEQRVAHCASRQYALGRVNPKFVEWVKTHRPDLLSRLT